jgi:uncharacterized hydrophobic protein (TIGR00341 family)
VDLVFCQAPFTVAGVKLVKICSASANLPTIEAIAETCNARVITRGEDGEDDLRPIELLVSDQQVQAVLDSLQRALGGNPEATVVVVAVEAALPKASDEERREEDKAIATREALFDQAEKGARLDSNYLLLVALSTIVAAIGLLEDSVAVVIGAMVIAPLLGPNLALGLGSALGDKALIRQALQAGVAGLGLALLLSLIVGFVFPMESVSHELSQRTRVGVESVALALASGAAAALSLTTGLSSVLVGVMVAVALLPPTATVGIMLGAGYLELAGRAALLLAVNIVSVNLAAKLVFLARGIRPRTGSERRRARQSTRVHLLVWFVTLALLTLVIVLIAGG